MHVLPLTRVIGVLRSSVLAIAIAAGGISSAAEGQIALTHTEDAAQVPSGTLRVRIATGWSRFDERFIATGTRSLDDEISATALGTQQLSQLSSRETTIQRLTGDATRLSFGRLAAQSDVRTVTTPIALEFGVTRRLSVGIMVPLVQTRRNVHLFVNRDSSNNVNFVTVRNRSAAATSNLAVYTGFIRAADSLGVLLSKCPANPSASGCTAVNANAAEVRAAQQQAQIFAVSVRDGFGTDTTTALLAPRTGGALAANIDAKRTALNTLVQKYLGASAGASNSVFTLDGPFTYVDLQGREGTPGLLQSPLVGLDSIQTTNRLALGGLTLAAQYQVFDGFARDQASRGSLQMRAAVGGAVRFESLKADSARHIGSVSPGTGSGVSAHGALDLISGRFGGTLFTKYDKSFARTVNAPIYGDLETYYPIPVFFDRQRTDGAVITLDASPRYFLTDWISLEGLYGLEHSGTTTFSAVSLNVPDCALVCSTAAPTNEIAGRTAQRVGFGLRYSTFDSWARGRTGTPIEVSYRHLETITGDPGTAKIFRDEVQVRLFFPVLSR